MKEWLLDMPVSHALEIVTAFAIGLNIGLWMAICAR